MESALDWTIIRPPAVFGPGDTDMLDLFRMVGRGIALLPPPGRMSAIYVDELARLLLAVTADKGETLGRIYEPDDGQDGGWTHREFARAIGRAVGRPRVPALSVPAAVLKAGHSRQQRCGSPRSPPMRRSLKRCAGTANRAGSDVARGASSDARRSVDCQGRAGGLGTGA